MAQALPAAPGAVLSLVLGIISVVTCGFPTGPFAIWQGRSAEGAIKSSPGHYGSKGLATAGWILGIVGTVLMVGWIIYWVVIVLILGVFGSSGSSTSY